MRLDRRRARAIRHKELAEFRRNRSLVASMAVVPLLFCVQPLVQIAGLDPAAASPLRHQHLLLYLLGIPALVPAFIAACSVVGEREQGTLEPVLTTPVRREELLLGKATAALLPAAAVSYLVFAAFLAGLRALASPAVASALLRPGDLVAQLVGTPLLAGWTIWASMAISSRVGDVRVALQLSTLAGLPSVVLTTLLAVGVLPASAATVVGSAIALLALNVVGLRLAAATFDRERLVTGRPG